LLDLVDTPGPLAGSPVEPLLRLGVSKTRTSFATERIQYWVSDPINAGSARMEARLGASSSRTSKRAAKSNEKVLHEICVEMVRDPFRYCWGLCPQPPR